MNRKVYDLLVEAVGRVYRGLIDPSINYCSTALLVVQGTMLSATAMEVLLSLDPFLEHKARASSWPGTELYGEGPGATVYRYRLKPECVRVLTHATESLYGWLQPELPEDLCPLRPDGSAWLVSIAHERDGYFQLTPEERRLLSETLPDLVVSMKER